MSTDVTKASLAGQKETMAEEAPATEPVRRIGEGLGVFRALLLMIMFYAAVGFLAWFGWHAFQHWRGH